MPYEPITRLNHYGAKNPLARTTKPEEDGVGAVAVEMRRRQAEADSWGRVEDYKWETGTTESQPEPKPQRPMESGWREPAIIGGRSDAPAVSGTSNWRASAGSSVRSVEPQCGVAGEQGGGGALPIPCKSLDNYDDIEREERRQQKQRRRELRRQFILGLRGQNPDQPTAFRASQEFEDIPLTPSVRAPLSITKPSQIPLPSSRRSAPHTPVATLPRAPRTSLPSPPLQSKLAFIHNCLQANYGDGYLSRMLVVCDGNEMEVVRRLTTGDIPKAMRDADPMMPLDEHGRFSLDDKRKNKKKGAGKT
jgi:hypothetical protein